MTLNKYKPSRLTSVYSSKASIDLENNGLFFQVIFLDANHSITPSLTGLVSW
jgi:hypothetical protein